MLVALEPVPRVLTDRVPVEVVVLDELDRCPYIDHKTTRLTMRMPLRPLSLLEFDSRLAMGDRRHGSLLYSPDCPNCALCEAIRVDVQAFRPSKTQRRVLRSGDKLLRVELGPTITSSERVDLYEQHLKSRKLTLPDHTPMTAAQYRSFFQTGIIPSFEIRLMLNSNIVGIAVTDFGSTAISAHYTYFDTSYPHLSLGTYAILSQIRIAKELGMQHVYLGLFVRQNTHMQYKTSFRPHDLRIDGVWQRPPERQ